MMSLVRMSALSAVLSYGAVGAIEPAQEPAETGSTKLYHERIQPDLAATPLRAPMQLAATGDVRQRTGAKGDRLAPPNAACSGQSWPYYTAACMAGEAAVTDRHVRVITVETREGGNTSILQRIPQPALAQR